jgi:toxin ParE1/3/4
MQVRWSPASVEDLEQIFNYIRTDSPRAAQRVVQTIYDRVEALASDPYLGRRGRVEGTRELPLPPLPFIVVYRVLEQAERGRKGWRALPQPVRECALACPVTRPPNNQPPTTNNQPPLPNRVLA